MVKLNKIYTRTGDGGTTGLVSGSRVSKDDIRIEAFGTVDEGNSVLGCVRLHTKNHPELDQQIQRIQNDLFDLGADLATPYDENATYEPLRIKKEQVTRLEAEIDAINANLEPLKSFILPGGSEVSTHLHLARTIIRRAERRSISLAKVDADINQNALKYLNRLSDLLFVLARAANENGQSDIVWVPGKNR